MCTCERGDGCSPICVIVLFLCDFYFFLSISLSERNANVMNLCDAGRFYGCCCYFWVYRKLTCAWHLSMTFHLCAPHALETNLCDYNFYVTPSRCHTSPVLSRPVYNFFLQLNPPQNWCDEGFVVVVLLFFFFFTTLRLRPVQESAFWRRYFVIGARQKDKML